jgi:uncharacterized membrane protein
MFDLYLRNIKKLSFSLLIMPKKEMTKKEHELHEKIYRKVLHKLTNPITKRFTPRDVIKIVVGASLLAIPVGFTEETWRLGEKLPLSNIIALLSISILFIGTFVIAHHHRSGVKNTWPHLLNRAVSTYVLSFIVVAVLLTLIQQAPWSTDWLLAFKRVVIVTFPSSMSAALVDTI